MDRQIYSCALGAAYEAITGRSKSGSDLQEIMLDATGVDLFHIYVQHPITGEDDERTLYWAISNLNDVFEWTREAIADWLEGIGY